jgi:hypothetical protein
MTDTNKINDEVFENDDFVFTERTNENGDKEIFGGGYRVESMFLKEGLSPIITINNGKQMGGKVSSAFENLAVPAGLYYVNMKAPKKERSEHYEERSSIISDELMDKLYDLISLDKKPKKKTKKQITKPVRKTRRR